MEPEPGSKFAGEVTHKRRSGEKRGRVKCVREQGMEKGPGRFRMVQRRKKEKGWEWGCESNFDNK